MTKILLCQISEEKHSQLSNAFFDSMGLDLGQIDQMAGIEKPSLPNRAGRVVVPFRKTFAVDFYVPYKS